MPITYADLLSRAPQWLYANNRSLVDQMPVIVQQAHEQLLNVMDHDLFNTVIAGKVITTASGGVLDLSEETPRVLEVRALRVDYRSGMDSFTPLMKRNLETMTMLYAENRPNRPRYYATYSGPLVLKVFPAPNMNYPLEVTANVEPEILSDETQENIITRQFPRAIEMAVFRQAALYMKNRQDIETYGGEMMSAVTEANAQIQRRRRDETGTRPTETSNVAGS